MSFIKRTLFLLLGVLGLYSQSGYALEPNEVLERQVKSAYIFKFGNYITWPDNIFTDATSPIIIGVVDDDMLANELERIAVGHLTGSRPVMIKKLSAKDMNVETHILYVASNASKLVTTYRNAHPQAATLYITDTVDGLSAGSVINFVHDNNRLRFDVSLAVAEQSKIKLDASLLTVARQVINK